MLGIIEAYSCKLTRLLAVVLVSGFKIAKPQSETRGIRFSSSRILEAFKLPWVTGGENVECR